MNSIFNNFKKDIESHVMDFLDSISTEYKLDHKEIKSRWEKFTSDQSVINSIVPETSKPELSIVVNNELNDAKTCCYVFIKGKNAGSCCSNATKNDNKYCTKHIKFETDDKKDKKKIIPKLVDNKKMVLMNLQDTPFWWNKETGLIFISSENKTVIAKYNDGQINKLSADDVSNCDKNNLKYDINFNLDLNPVKPKEDEVIVNNKKKLIAPEDKKTPILNDEDKKKKLEIYKTNACAKNVEDVLSNILNNDSDDEDDDEDDFIEEEKEEEEEEKEEEEEDVVDDEDLDLEEEDDLDLEDEYLDEEM